MILSMTRSQEIKLESLDDGPGLLPYKLGLMRLTTHHHTFLQYVQLQEIENNVQLLQTQLLSYRNVMTNDTFLLYEIQIDYLTNKLGKVLNQLNSLEPNRVKRGLIDGLGSVIKSITGNLDHSDALKYDEAIRTLESNQNKMASEFNSHISMSKEWMSKHSDVLEQLLENQDKINATIELILQSDSYRENSLVKYAKFAQLLEVISENVEDLMQEIIRIENSLAFIRASSTHHSMIDIGILELMVNKLKMIYSRDQILDLDLREYYDIIKPGSYYSNNQIVFVFQFPIVSRDEYDFYRLSIVPNKYAQALIPSFPFIATNELSFVYIEAECPKLRDRYLCEQEVTHQIRTKSDCIHELITGQVLQDSCKLTTVTLAREAMEKLDDQHYVLSFPHSTKVQLSCSSRNYTSLQGSYIITIPIGCRLKSEQLNIVNDNDEVRSQPFKIFKTSYNTEKQATEPTHLHLKSINLKELHSIQEKMVIQTPLQLENVKLDAFYHTTIPFYAVISSAAALSIIIICRHYLRKYSKETKKSQQPPAITLEKCEDPGNVPATFSLNVLK